MDKTKVIVVLLILAIVFSIMSIIISFSVSNISLPGKSVNLRSSTSGAAGNVVFVVEGNRAGGVG